MRSKFLSVTALMGAACLLSSGAQAQFFANSIGLSDPHSTVTFSEITLPQNTIVTNQYAAYGITLSGEHYNSQGNSPFPGITGDYVGVSTTSPFSIFFNASVNEAAFGYAKNPATVTVEALLNGVVVASANQAVTYNNTNTGYLGFTGFTFNQIRVNAGTTEGLIDNIQFGNAPIRTPTAVPEPGSIAMIAGMGLSGAGFLVRRRKLAHKSA